MNILLPLYMFKKKNDVLFQLQKTMQKYSVRNPNGTWVIFFVSFYLWRGIYYLGIMVGRSSCDEHMIQLFIQKNQW